MSSGRAASLEPENRAKQCPRWKDTYFRTPQTSKLRRIPFPLPLSLYSGSKAE